MNVATNDDSAWQLSQTKARLTSGAFNGEVDVARPQHGLRQPNLDQGPLPCTLLSAMRRVELQTATAHTREINSLSWPLSLAETYVRGNDLVASYSPAAEWPYSPQLYWQARTLQSIDGVLGSISMLVSVQTHLLDTHPKINVASQIPSSEFCFISLDSDEQAVIEPVSSGATVKSPTGTCCVLWRLLARPLSYVEIVSAADLHQISFEAGRDSPLVATWQLLAEFLEKGVIRRARVHGALLQHENDIELAIECCRATEKIPLPLTT